MLRYLLVFLAGALLGANAVYYLMTRDQEPAADAIVVERAPTPVPGQTEPPAPPIDDATALPPAIQAPAPAAATNPTPPTPSAIAPLVASAVMPAPSGLIVPVMGIGAGQLSDTFDDARGSGRVHDALDIMAPRGTAVLAVADGHVEKLFDSKQGGLTLYQFDPTGKFAYYYAHLDRYAPGLAEGRKVRRGDVIGYVGSTGNADPSAPHLHFAVFVLGPERQWWKGTAINPYPLLGGK